MQPVGSIADLCGRRQIVVSEANMKEARECNPSSSLGLRAAAQLGHINTRACHIATNKGSGCGGGEKKKKKDPLLAGGAFFIISLLCTPVVPKATPTCLRLSPVLGGAIANLPRYSHGI